jgi:hypothetical protein
VAAGSTIRTTSHVDRVGQSTVVTGLSRSDHAGKETQMKTTLTVLAATALFGLVLTSTPAFAQGAKVNFPFDFTAMGRLFPAGVYQFTEKSPDVVKLESETSPALQIELPVIAREPMGQGLGHSKAVFDRVGKSDVLSQVWISGYDGYVLFAPKTAVIK